MKLLICTQVVDRGDQNLGFFHRWIEEFAHHAEHVTVVCLRAGDYAFPSNVRVYQIGKGNKITRAFRFLRLIYKFRLDYTRVFVHMNPEYIVLGGIYWRLRGKKIALWYAHKSLTLKLRIATFFATSVCSVTDISFPIPTHKLHGLGHGIDTELFVPHTHRAGEGLRIITAGRIAGSKHLLEMVSVILRLKERGLKPVLTIAGEASTPAEHVYKTKLIEEIARCGLKDSVHMVGSVRHTALPELFSGNDVFLNFGSTGNMDKAGFEPLAMGLPLVSTNTAFRDLLTPYGLYEPIDDIGVITEAIVRARTLNVEPLMHYVRTHHSLQRLIPKIIATLS